MDLEPSQDHLVVRICNAYESGRLAESDTSNPFTPGSAEAEAWAHGRKVSAVLALENRKMVAA